MSKHIGIYICDGYVSSDLPPVVLDSKEDVELVLEDDAVNTGRFDGETDQLIVFEILEGGATKPVSQWSESSDDETYGWRQL